MMTLTQTSNSMMIVTTYTRYFSPNRTNHFLKQSKSDNFHILHLNIRSFKKNIDFFRILLSQLNFSFKVICLTETWCEQKNESTNSLYNLPNYTYLMYQIWKVCKGGSVCIYTKNSLVCTNRKIQHELWRFRNTCNRNWQCKQQERNCQPCLQGHQMNLLKHFINIYNCFWQENNIK